MGSGGKGICCIRKLKTYVVIFLAPVMIQQLTLALALTRVASCKINSYTSKQQEYDEDGFMAQAPVNFSKGDCSIWGSDPIRVKIYGLGLVPSQ